MVSKVLNKVHRDQSLKFKPTQTKCFVDVRRRRQCSCGCNQHLHASLVAFYSTVHCCDLVAGHTAPKYDEENSSKV